MIGNINEIIGIKSSVKEEAPKTPCKTSIMTTSTGKTLKRKHEDDATDDVLVIADDNAAVAAEKKIAIEKILAEPKSEITITPIRKVSAEDKSNGKEAEIPSLTVA
jgi:hypothetical protein